jgi:hypothetical protein
MLSISTAAPSMGDEQPRCQPAYMPRLSYRNSLPADESAILRPSSSRHDAPNSSGTDLQTPTVSAPPSTAKTPQPRSSNTSSAKRPTTAAGTRTSSAAGNSTIAPAPTKKRRSLFSGLFVKEPSSIALEQLAQKLIAEHGELSARAIPGVSSATMPKTVPKVNSKWDGKPVVTRLKDSRGSEGRDTKSTSSGSSVRSRSAELSERDYASSCGNHREQWHFSSSSSVSRESEAGQYSAPQTPASTNTFHSSTKGSLSATALGKMPRPHSTRSQSLRSPSGSSLPQITAFFPDHQIPDPPTLPSKFRTDENAHTTLPIRSKPAGLSRSRAGISITPEPLTEASSDNISSHSTTSSKASPATPLSTYTPIRNVDNAPSEEHDGILASFAQPKPEDVVLLSSGRNVLGPPAGAKRKVRPSTKPFLAGEARPLEIPDDGAQDPQNAHQQGGIAESASSVLSHIARVQQDLEKRPDSSRVRLGLRASMLVNKDILPWQSQENVIDGSTVAPESTVSSAKKPTSPRFKPKKLRNLWQGQG